MSRPVYSYLPIRARGELPRLINAVGNLGMKDVRVSFADFPKVKELSPFGQLGMLEVDGRRFAQKVAISIYLAKQCGLYEPTPNSDLAQLQRDSVLLLLEDLLEAIVKGFTDRNFANKPETLANAKDAVIPAKMPYLEKILVENGSGFYCGSKMTFVDLAAFDVIEHVVDLRGQGYLNGFPNVKANFAKLSALPSLKKYVEQRPVPDKGFEF